MPILGVFPCPHVVMLSASQRQQLKRGWSFSI
jgi:hypothetical protein